VAGWGWIERRRPKESNRRNIIHSLLAISPEEIAQGLLLSQHTSNGSPCISRKCGLL